MKHRLSPADGEADGSSLLALEVPLALAICVLYVFVALAIHEYKRTHGRAPWIHESSLSCVFGLLAGGLLQLSTGRAIVFSNDFFFYLVLPPIIFSAGFGLRKKRFFQHIHLILLFGLLGTLANFLLIACGIRWYEGDGDGSSWNKAFLLAAVLCGTDEVSAMSLVPIRLFPRMGALIFGEGVLNDALSIVFFETFFPLSSHSAVPSVPSILTAVLLQLTASLAIGGFLGLLLSLLMKRFNSSLRHFSVYQTALVILFGYLSYSSAEAVGMSGILTLFVCAILLAHYCFHSLSRAAQIATKISFAATSDIAEGFAFAYVGLSLWGSSYYRDVDLRFTAFLLALLMAARLLAVVCLSAAHRSPSALGLREQMAFALGGSVRGSLCWAQALQLKDRRLVASCLLVVLVTTLLGGLCMPVALPLLLTPSPPPSSIPCEHVPAESTPLKYSINSSVASASATPLAPPGLLSRLFVRWIAFDEQVMKRLFGGSVTDQRRRALLQTLSAHSAVPAELGLGPSRILDEESQDDSLLLAVAPQDASLQAMQAIHDYFDTSQPYATPRGPQQQYYQSSPAVRARVSSALEVDQLLDKDEEEAYFDALSVLLDDELSPPSTTARSGSKRYGDSGFLNSPDGESNSWLDISTMTHRGNQNHIAQNRSNGAIGVGQGIGRLEDSTELSPILKR